MEIKLKNRKVSNKKSILFCILSLVLVLISVGYAYIRTSLQVEGDINFSDFCADVYILGVKQKACTNWSYNADEEQTLFIKSRAKTDENPILYFSGTHEYTNNNVIFANKCWKAIRTTETGGLKLLYNGHPASTITTSPISRAEYTSVVNDDYYPFEYDSISNEWKSTNQGVDYSTVTIEFHVATAGEYYFSYRISSGSYDSVTVEVNGTKKVDGVRGVDSDRIKVNLTTSDVIKVTYEKDSSSSFGKDNIVFSLGKKSGEILSACSNTRNDFSIETGENTNVEDYYGEGPLGKFNSKGNTLSSVGYMYNDEAANQYSMARKDMSSSGQLEGTPTPIAYSDYVSPTFGTYTFNYDSSTKYWVSQNKTNDSRNNTLSSIQFKVKTAGEYNFVYNLSIQSGDTVTVYINGEENGKYGYAAHDSPKGSLYLGNLAVNDEVKVTYSRSYYSATEEGYIEFYLSKAVNNGTDKRWLYGNSVVYSGGVYTLQNVKKTTWGLELPNHHYTCFSTGYTCSEVNYIYNVLYNSAFYMKLNGGKTIEDAINESFPNDATRNKTDSTIKGYIDKWFASSDGMLDYLNYLEDTVYCNNRTISDLGGWNPNGGKTDDGLDFRSVSSESLECPNKLDRFTLKSTKLNSNSNLDGNQLLDYPVGLLTVQEIDLSYPMLNTTVHSYLSIKEGSDYYSEGLWSMSPNDILYDSDVEIYVASHSGGHSNYVAANMYLDVRPVVSLKSGIVATGGNGSMDYPYIVG